MMKILALIPARGGSKGVLKKNIRPLCGKPLIAYSIEVAKASPFVDRVMVSTDDEEIATIAKACGAEVPFMRPAELAGDTSKVMDAIVDHLERLKNTEGYEPTHLLLLQTTSPLRRSSDIDRAVELFNMREADSLVSMCPTENYLFTKDDEDRLTRVQNAVPVGANRQQSTKCYRLDGCMIYLIKTDVLLRERSFLAGKLIGYEIEKWRALDIDEPQDFVLSEYVKRHEAEIEAEIASFNNG